MSQGHIMRAFDDELAGLTEDLALMARRAELQAAAAQRALIHDDDRLAAWVVGHDARIDSVERAINELAVRLLALRRPRADDLRFVVAALQVAGEVERVGDYAAAIAKRVPALRRCVQRPPLRAVDRIQAAVLVQFRRAMDAFLARDSRAAVAVWLQDQDIDSLYGALFRELLTYMMEDPRSIGACTHLVFVAKSAERIGDLATNVAEITYYLVEGQPLETVEGDRPKADMSSYAVGVAAD